MSGGEKKSHAAAPAVRSSTANEISGSNIEGISSERRGAINAILRNRTRITGGERIISISLAVSRLVLHLFDDVNAVNVDSCSEISSINRRNMICFTLERLLCIFHDFTLIVR